ncbi:hypothetical protein C9F11_08905 [Streptomyces sp. YIM 121038]|uniref:hypothetical protein n=1 Tax=Streptomyces sp. YIM 121038 TaxID=2136401 RepID=UPI0011102EF9|nr:hypothetical protein [Streptomyces sp. YIM 121038]QCX75470.1 hypothetical protein C9F11_08905 [Streptomyces sp. YIM 121038]
MTDDQREDIVFAMSGLLGEAHDITFHQCGGDGEGWAYQDDDATTVYDQARHNADRIEAKLKILRKTLRTAQSTANLRHKE